MEIENKLEGMIKTAMIDTFKHLMKTDLKETIKKEFVNAIYEATLPEWIKGDKKAGEIINLDGHNMAKRRARGYYIEGKDWKKENPNLKNGNILWNKDTLLKERERL